MREDEVRARALAKVLRRNMPRAETILWSRLRRGGRENGHKFRRQHPIGPYVSDFACISARVVIEVDGPTHESPEEHARDDRRDAFMRARGWHVFRVRNEDIYKDSNDVMWAIESFLRAPPRV
jgi:very-short-patch-repair endonuclease